MSVNYNYKVVLENCSRPSSLDLSPTHEACSFRSEEEWLLDLSGGSRGPQSTSSMAIAEQRLAPWHRVWTPVSTGVTQRWWFPDFLPVQSKVLAVQSATSVHSTAAVAAANTSGEVHVQLATSGDPRFPLLTTWSECSANEIRRIVMAAPLKSSSLDPIPTFLLRECIDVILPYMTAMVNTSLRCGCLPANEKTTTSRRILLAYNTIQYNTNKEL